VGNWSWFVGGLELGCWMIQKIGRRKYVVFIFWLAWTCVVVKDACDVIYPQCSRVWLRDE
jgi:hypothetical protein